MARLPNAVPIRLEPYERVPVCDLLDDATRALVTTLQAVLLTQRSEAPMLEASGVAEQAELVQPTPPPADVALSVLRKLVDGIHAGKSLEALYPQLSRLIANQERRAEIVDQLLLTSEFDRATTLAQARARLEHDLIISCYRNELTAHERMDLLEVLVPLEREARNRIKSGALPINDLLAQIQKMDSTLAIDEEALRSKFSKTTPQGREVVRKLAMRLSKATRAQSS